MTHRLRVASGAAWLLPTAAAAEAAGTVPGGAATFAQLALSLGLVVVLILAFAWLARRLRLAPQGGSGALRILAQVPVGPRERIVLLAVGERQALVGVTGAGITSLALLDEEVVARGGEAASPGREPPLAERMRAMLERRGGP